MYATGSAANPSALLAAVQTFAVSAGWTVARASAVYNPGSTTPNDYWLAIHQGACYLNYYYRDLDQLFILYAADGYSGSSTPFAQGSIQSPAPSYMNPGRGAYTSYHLFSTTAGPIYLHLVLEWEASVFTHLHGGILNAAGGAGPAIYTSSTAWNYGGSESSYPEGGPNTSPFGNGGPSNGYQVQVTVDGVSRIQIAGGSIVSPNRLIAPVRPGGFQQRGIVRTPNTFNELTVLFPLHTHAERLAGNVWSYIGEPFDVRGCNIQNVNPKDEITLGSDVWKYFPATAKTGPSVINIFNSTVISSGYYGYAFRKNA